MSINFIPKQNTYSNLGAFRYWCQKVLPLVYDDSLSYYELLCKVVNYLNETIENVDLMGDDIQKLYTAYEELHGFVDGYFTNLDVQHEINNKLDSMAKDGSLSILIQPLFDAYKREIDDVVTEQNTEIDVLKTRMNTFTALQNGSTTGDAELADARVDYTGKEWDNVGEHLRNVTSQQSEQNAELKSDLTELSESINDISYDRFSFNLIKNSYVALDGSIIPYDRWSRTDYIDCQNWGKLVIHSDGTHNVYNCFYDSNHTFITTFTIENGDNTIQIPPNTKYFILSGTDENMDVTYITSTLRKDLDDAKTSLDNIENEVVKIVHNIKQSIVAYNAYWINVPIEKDVSYTIINNSDGTIDLATYTEDKSTLIESLTTMSPNSNYTFTANNDAYYLLMYPSANGEIEIIDNSTELEKIKADIDSLLTIGVGTDYQTIKEGFAEAVRLNKGVLISAGEYDLVAEGIDGIGYILPKKVIGYGAILRCDLPEENWSLSPLNCDYTSPLDVEVYGLTVICSNCRYNIHDDMGAMARGAYYRHVFKDLTLIHNSAPSSVLINPNNIGGGFGDMGEILIENCIMESQSDVNSDYHSSFAEVQTKGCKATFKDCVLNKTITSASLGSDTSYMNKVYVTNCLCGTVPVNVTYTNNSLIGWNNVQS